ncbi:N-acetyltransferase [Pseudovibrio japonicus]|uniref:N-acetyltransferase n=1 Tax=Pseudovibrio japonicus TaxID=366534 RepID=A0ABQ3E8Z0_9HYPH|nr:GNAT family N-acetyltransferase [Pseudovibrio japonicus]GHB27173.1 N-acetyltransferase [Pseudovibrio japonicus]
MIEGVIDKSPRIETERLTLRKWEQRDLDGLAEMNADPLVREFFPQEISYAVSERMLSRMLSKQETDGFCFPVVEDRVSGMFLGFCGLGILDHSVDWPFEGEVEIGWRLISNAWGKGIATEAARFWLGFGFDTQGFGEVVSCTSARNSRSRSVMQRLGMVWDVSEDFDHPQIEEGHPLRRHVIYRLSRDKFAGQNHD